MIHAVRTLLVRVALGAALVLGLTAAPAGADAAGPSDFRSEVTGLEPAAEGVTAEIRGGDSFLELTVESGHTVVVEGYEGEPYLRFNPDGTIERNRLSQATYINDDRRGGGTIPPDALEADADTEPEWEQIATGGRYAWHDHRVHWMRDASPSVARGERVGGAYDPWLVPLAVDGAKVEVQGTLTYEKTLSPVVWAVVAVAAAAALAWVGRTRSLRVGAVALVVVAAVAAVIGRAEWASTPDGGGNPLLWVLALVALVAAAIAVPLATRTAGAVAALASVAALSGWGIFRIQSLVKPVLPTDLPFTLDRATIAVALGASVATAYLALTTGALSLPALEDDDDDADDA